MHLDALKYLIKKSDLSGRLARWVLLLQEYYFTIVVRPRKSHGNAYHLSRLEPLAPSNLEPLNDQLPNADLFEVDVIFLDYIDIITYLKTNQASREYNAKQVVALLRSAPFILIGEILYKQGHDGLLRQCINPSEVLLILEGCHSDACGGHFASESTARKVLLASYWWPTLFKDAHSYTRKCDLC